MYLGILLWAIGPKKILILCWLETLHQLADGHILLSSKAGWLKLEIVHDEFQCASGFVLGRRFRVVDGRDCAGFRGCRRLWLHELAAHAVYRALLRFWTHEPVLSFELVQPARSEHFLLDLEAAADTSKKERFLLEHLIVEREVPAALVVPCPVGKRFLNVRDPTRDPFAGRPTPIVLVKVLLSAAQDFRNSA